jgi:NAD-dependent dihydropyrimidine dehydrogenase PreA subunit
MHNGHSVWRAPAATSGIHGTRVAVDLDLCTGCLKCLTLCPVNVFVRWAPQPGQSRVDPAGESDCLECLACEIVCPVDAILIARTVQPGDTLKPLVD